ncbi:TetR/AcrR family transcriptional regulator [Nesterenkonia ebinurensis]|uniref:TetR/AcrR family transcriptional regulator n=1 Tax=Nesterenkonia ebinurensis TaxID=2608252 RepID=UPI00123CFFE3|nr:TetR/AcrR family transcriptional regulator [Nesterenkonia ebinurensis]
MAGRRSYSSPLRAADAAQTRARIVDAAAELFVRDGYAATPMRAIAQRAGVSVQSVHLAGPKSALLIAAFERAFAGDEGRHSLLERPAIAAIVAEPDPGVLLDRYVEFLVEANRRAAGIIHALRAAADADPQARAAYDDLEQRRARDMRMGAELFVERGLVAPEDLQRTADVLGYLTGPEAYLHFVESAGWSLDAYAAWLRESLGMLAFGQR